MTGKYTICQMLTTKGIENLQNAGLDNSSVSPEKTSHFLK